MRHEPTLYIVLLSLVTPLMLVNPRASSAQEHYFAPPGEEWRALGTQESAAVPGAGVAIGSIAGLDVAYLKLAADFSKRHSPDATLLVMRDDWIAFEDGDTTVVRAASELTAALAALAVTREPGGSAAAPASEWVSPESQVAPVLPPAWNLYNRYRSQLTFGQLFDGTSGLAVPSPFWDRMPGIREILGQDIEFEPGTSRRESTFAYDLASIALQLATGASLETAMTRDVLGPIGADVAWSNIGASGVTRASSGALLSTRDLARIGQLLLHDGQWSQRRLLSAKDLVGLRRAITQIPEVSPGIPFGAFRGNDDGSGVGPSVPADAYFAVGSGENLMIIVPSLHMVVVRMGDAPTGSTADGFRQELMEQLMLAVVDEDQSAEQAHGDESSAQRESGESNEIADSGTSAQTTRVRASLLATSTTQSTRRVYFSGDFVTSSLGSRSSLTDGFFLRTVPTSQALNDVNGCKLAASEPKEYVACGAAPQAGPTSGYDFRVVASEVVGGESVRPRTGGYFLRTEISRKKDYSKLNGGGSVQKPRGAISPSHSIHQQPFDTEIWLGFSVYLPRNYVQEKAGFDDRWSNQLLTVNPDSTSSTQFALNLRGTSTNSTTQWMMKYYIGSRSINEANAQSYFVSMGTVTEDLGKWTDFVIRYRINPFTTATTVQGTDPSRAGYIAGARSGTYSGNRGILQVWKSVGTVDAYGNRTMKLVLNKLNTPVGLVPTSASNLLHSFRQYKYGWNSNPTTVTGPIWVGLDAVYFGQAIAHGTTFSDVHAAQKPQPL